MVHQRMVDGFADDYELSEATQGLLEAGKGLIDIIDGERSDRANAILEWVRAVADLREEVFKQIEQERIGT